MKQLLLLTLCLLATFKSISQNDIQIENKPYVILTEKQAKDVIKDLIHMDALEQTNIELEARIDNLLQKELVYKKVISTKDTIISNKDKIIDLKDKIINAKKPIEFHAYGGAKTYNLEFSHPIFYARGQLEFKKMNIGAMANYQPVIPNSDTDGFHYNIYVEFKIF